MPAEIWFAVVNGFRHERPIAILEPRGSGRSGDITAVDGSQYAADVFTAMDFLGWESAHIAGISMGGMIAQCAAVRDPSRVKSLALICTYARPGPWTELVWKLRLHLHDFGDLGLAHLAAALFLTGPSAVDADPKVIDRLTTLWTQAPPRPVSYRAQMQFCAAHDLANDLTRINVPALVVAGGQDLLCSRSTSEELAGALRAEFVEFPSATHLLSGEQPDALARVIEQHFISVDEGEHARSTERLTSL
jgi:pimeloyl-ACP methyl ester carboxylesterase